MMSKDHLEALEEGKRVFCTLPKEVQEGAFSFLNSLLLRIGYFSNASVELRDIGLPETEEFILSRMQPLDMNSRRLALRYATQVLLNKKSKELLKAIFEPDDGEVDDSPERLFAIELINPPTDAPLFFVCFIPEGGNHKAAYDDPGHAEKFTTQDAAMDFLRTASFEETHRIHQYTFGEASLYCESIVDKMLREVPLTSDDLKGIFAPDNATIL